MKYFNEDGSIKKFPATQFQRYEFAHEENERRLLEGHITRHQYYIESRNIEREFYGDDYV